jgi:hypothetical protein
MRITAFVVPIALVAAFGALAVLPVASTFAFPDPGQESYTISGTTSITGRIGNETITLSGSVTISHGAPYMDGSIGVVDTEIVALNLSGTSVTGPVTASKRASPASTGELRSVSGSSFPATSFFDVYVDVTIPGSPTNPLSLYTGTPLHFTSMTNLLGWPINGITYVANPSPCILLQPSIQNPAQVCITSATFVFPQGVGGLTELAEPAADGSSEAPERSGSRAAGVAIGLAGFAVLSATSWYARRELLRNR